MRLHESAWLGRIVPVRQVQLARPRVAPPRRPFLGQGNGNVIESMRSRGPILPIQVGLPMASAGEDPTAIMEEVQALVDTGASITAINMETATRLGLIPTGSVDVSGVTGSSTQPLFGARIVMPEPGFTFDPIEIVGAPLSSPDFEILIGRNLLCSMLMSYDGTRGQFALTK
jgi:hypothetical protein